jgi:hypothetical protein
VPRYAGHLVTLREVLLLEIPVVFDDGDLSCAPGIRHQRWLSRENWNRRFQLFHNGSDGRFRPVAHVVEQAVLEVQYSISSRTSNGTKNQTHIKLLGKDQADHTNKSEHQEHKPKEGKHIKIKAKLGTERTKEGIIERSRHDVNRQYILYLHIYPIRVVVITCVGAKGVKSAPIYYTICDTRIIFFLFFLVQRDK